jgi:hypothetical protein
MNEITLSNEHAVSSIVAGLHAEGAPADRAAHLLLRAGHEVERRRQSSPPSPAGSEPKEERHVTVADRFGPQPGPVWGWVDHHLSGAPEWFRNPESEREVA